MTSDGTATECFVYITLPGETKPVTAGRFVQERQRSGLTLGRFVYGRRYLARPDSVAFDPVELKLSDRTYDTIALGGVFGALRDSGPDYWGRRVIERHAGKPQLGELDYLLHSAEELRRASARPDLDAQELFRRMCFNALISNADDHSRNHAMIARHTDWRLSPAYDLTPTSPVSQDHRDLALVIGDQGRFANAQNLLSQCSRFLLTREAATATMVAMTRKVANRWYDIARDAGVSESDCTLIAGAFA
jgi:hypothetical protein